MRKWILLVPVVFAVAGASCNGLFERHPELPPLPSIEVTTTDEAILAQVAAAREKVEDDPYDARANGELGALYELYQRPEGARVCYERAVALAPDELRWTYHLGRVEKAWGDAVVARTVLERAVTIDPSYAPAVALLGELELDAGNLDQAADLFTRVLDLQPRSCSGLLGLGRIHAEREEHAEALKHYGQALEIAPSHAPLHYAAGISLRALGATEPASQHLQFASAAGPANPDPDPLYEQILALEIGYERDYREAKALLGANRLGEAIPLLRKVVEADPQRIAAQGYLAKALMMTGDESALVEYGRAVELNPKNIDFLRPYALLLSRVGRLDEAEQYLREAMRLGGNHFDDHHILGVILLKQGRVPEAEAEFQVVLELKPDHTEAQQAIEMIHARRGAG